MAIGKLNIHGIVTAMGNAARMRDRDKARAGLEEIRDDIVRADAEAAMFEPYPVTRKRVDSNLGYLTGYMPQEYGNAVLQLLDVEHPVFGKTLDVTADQALAAGMRLAEQLQEQKNAEARRAKLAAKRAAGLDIPDADQPVTSDSAKALLEALRAKKAGAVLAPVTESVYGEKEVAEREVRKNALEKLAGIKTEAEIEKEKQKAEFEAAMKAAEDAEPDEYFDLEETASAEETPVADPAKEAAERARLLAEIDEAGAF